jgi:hypothetical protein
MIASFYTAERPEFVRAVFDSSEDVRSIQLEDPISFDMA